MFFIRQQRDDRLWCNSKLLYTSQVHASIIAHRCQRGHEVSRHKGAPQAAPVLGAEALGLREAPVPNSQLMVLLLRRATVCFRGARLPHYC